MAETPGISRLPPSVAAIVPCYNAGDRLKPVIDALLAVCSNVIVIDDGSTDGCTKEIDISHVRMVSFSENRGKGHALIAGYRAALGDPAVTCVASLDADGQHDPNELPTLYAAFVGKNADFLIGSREFGGGSVPLRSRFGNVLTMFVVKRLFGARMPDTQSGYRIASRRFLEAVLPKIAGGRYETEMELVAWALMGGFIIVAEPIRTIYEQGNPSSHFRKLRDSWQIYRALWRTARRARREGITT